MKTATGQKNGRKYEWFWMPEPQLWDLKNKL
jgi:hypothetical protein